MPEPTTGLSPSELLHSFLHAQETRSKIFKEFQQDFERLSLQSTTSNATSTRDQALTHVIVKAQTDLQGISEEIKRIVSDSANSPLARGLMERIQTLEQSHLEILVKQCTSLRQMSLLEDQLSHSSNTDVCITSNGEATGGNHAVISEYQEHLSNIDNLREECKTLQVQVNDVLDDLKAELADLDDE